MGSAHLAGREGSPQISLTSLTPHRQQHPKKSDFSQPLPSSSGKFILFPGQPCAMDSGRKKQGRYLFLFIFFTFLYWLVCNLIETCTVRFLGACPH